MGGRAGGDVLLVDLVLDDGTMAYQTALTNWFNHGLLFVSSVMIGVLASQRFRGNTRGRRPCRQPESEGNVATNVEVAKTSAQKSSRE